MRLNTQSNSIIRFIVILLIISLPANAQAPLDRSMIWSAYDVGSTGYNEASIIADALMQQQGIRIRIMPSGTSIGRLLPLKSGRVKYAFLATETYFATEGLHDFSSTDWGPQDLRVLLGRPSSIGFATAADANIKTLADLRGKRVTYVEANPSLNVKADALLSFAGLTWEDVNRVRMPSYSSALRGLVENTVDAAISSPIAPILYELASSPRGISWPVIDLEDTVAWARLDAIAPIFEPLHETIGAGMSAQVPATLVGYRYPMVVVYANLTEDDAYNMTKAIAMSYDFYKDSSPIMPSWHTKYSGRPPVDAPFHSGAIRYLKETGVWTAQDDVWNAQRLERMDQVKQAWHNAQIQAEAQNITPTQWTEFWANYRQTYLD